MLNKTENFKNISAGIQSLVIAIAVLVGGIWTAYIFYTELKVENARVQLQILEEKLYKKSNLEIDIAASHLGGKSPKKHYLITVTIHNKGSRGTVLKITPKSLQTALVVQDGNGKINFDSVSSHPWQLIGKNGGIWNPPAKIISSGEIDKIEYYTDFIKTGSYIISFRAEGSKADDKQAREMGLSYEKPIPWAASKYIYIE